MNIENMIYIYLFVCLSMIVFNVFTAIMFKRRDKRTVRVSESFKQRVERQLDRIRLGKRPVHAAVLFDIRGIRNCAVADRILLENVHIRSQAEAKRLGTRRISLYV